MKLDLLTNATVVDDAFRFVPKLIIIDERDFYRKGEHEDVMHVSERYIVKSDPYVVMPNI